jgi:hypothetical protein
MEDFRAFTPSRNHRAQCPLPPNTENKPRRSPRIPWPNRKEHDIKPDHHPRPNPNGAVIHALSNWYSHIRLQHPKPKTSGSLTHSTHTSLPPFLPSSLTSSPNNPSQLTHNPHTPPQVPTPQQHLHPTLPCRAGSPDHNHQSLN